MREGRREGGRGERDITCTFVYPIDLALPGGKKTNGLPRFEPCLHDSVRFHVAFCQFTEVAVLQPGMSFKGVRT